MNAHKNLTYGQLLTPLSVILSICFLTYDEGNYTPKLTFQERCYPYPSVAFVAYGQFSSKFLSFSINWIDALGINANVDVFYSIPLRNSAGDIVLEDDIEKFRDHLLSINGTGNLFLERSGIDFTNVAVALVEHAGEEFYYYEVGCVTQRIWSQCLAMASSMMFAAHSSVIPFSCYDLVVVGRFDAIAYTNIIGPKCFESISTNTLPLLRPPPLEYLIEDRIMAIPPCLLEEMKLWIIEC